MSYSYSVEGKVYNIPKANVPSNSLLNLLHTTKNKVTLENGFPKIDCTTEEFLPVYQYLTTGLIPSDTSMFDYFGITLYEDYNLSILAEEEMRAKMYQPENKNQPYNTDPYYNLIEVTEELWLKLKIGKNNNNNLLFGKGELEKASWKEVQERLKKLFILKKVRYQFPKNDLVKTESQSQVPYMFSIINLPKLLPMPVWSDPIIQPKKIIENKVLQKASNVLVAGGSIFSVLFGKEIKDMDLFIWNKTPEEAKSIIEEFTSQLKDHYGTIIRTGNALTIKLGKKKKYQFVLRLYRSPSEVLHGFDLDSCCMGFDGQKIWMTQRCLYSLTKGYNTVNFNRLSPSYEFRLVKYGIRGMPIFVPNLDKAKILTRELKEFFEASKNIKKGDARNTYGYVKQLKGLDILLYLEYRCNESKSKLTPQAIEKLAEETSDYSSVPFFNRFYETRIDELIEYLKLSRGRFPEASKKYMLLVYKLGAVCKYFNDFPEEQEEKNPDYPIYEAIDGLYVNSLHKRTKAYYFVGSAIYKFDMVSNIPTLIYELLGYIKPLSFPQKMTFKVTNPGEQMTNTFNKVVLEDNNIWYQGNFYKN